MTLTITLELDNDAFAESPASEIRTALSSFTAKLSDGDMLTDKKYRYTDRMSIRDSNGNTIGNAVFCNH